MLLTGESQNHDDSKFESLHLAGTNSRMGTATSVSDKIELKVKALKVSKGGHFILSNNLPAWYNDHEPKMPQYHFEIPKKLVKSQKKINKYTSHHSGLLQSPTMIYYE